MSDKMPGCPEIAETEKPFAGKKKVKSKIDEKTTLTWFLLSFLNLNREWQPNPIMNSHKRNGKRKKDVFGEIVKTAKHARIEAKQSKMKIYLFRAK